MGSSPSRESSPLFSYFRGSYETGLIPLTKHFFGREDDPNVSPRALRQSDRRELRRQLLQVRSDPAVLYALGRDKESIQRVLLEKLLKSRSSPAVSSVGGGSSEDHRRGMSEPISTLEEVREKLGMTHEEMERYFEENYWDVIPESNCTEADLDHFLDLVDDLMYETDEDMVLDPRYHCGSAYGPQPNDHPTSRLPECYSPIPCALCLAYPPSKTREGCFLLEGRYINIIGFFGFLSPAMQQAFKICKSALDVVKVAEADVAPTLASGQTTMYLNTSILTSAGDRTLERVLALSALMLRQQFHAASRKTLLLQRRRALDPLSASSIALTDSEAHSISVKPLPRPPTGLFKSRSADDDTDKSVVVPYSPFMPFQPGFAQEWAHLLSDQDETQMTWNYFERLSRIHVIVHAPSNNYSALKSLTENLAFLHCQVSIPPNKTSLILKELPKLSQGSLDGADTAVSEHAPCHLSSRSLVIFHVSPEYLGQAAMWASSLLHFPQIKGKWIQYKLKDEAESQRYTLQKKDDLIAHWRRSEKEEARAYLGTHTPQLLDHVRALQQETERARAAQASEVQQEIHADKDGRMYALNPSLLGTMLIGVRNKANRQPVVHKSSASDCTLGLSNSAMDNPSLRFASHPHADAFYHVEDPPTPFSLSQGRPMKAFRTRGSSTGVPSPQFQPVSYSPDTVPPPVVLLPSHADNSSPSNFYHSISPTPILPIGARSAHYEPMPSPHAPQQQSPMQYAVYAHDPRHSSGTPIGSQGAVAMQNRPLQHHNPAFTAQEGAQIPGHVEWNVLPSHQDLLPSAEWDGRVKGENTTVPHAAVHFNQNPVMLSQSMMTSQPMRGSPHQQFQSLQAHPLQAQQLQVQQLQVQQMQAQPIQNPQLHAHPLQALQLHGSTILQTPQMHNAQHAALPPQQLQGQQIAQQWLMDQSGHLVPVVVQLPRTATVGTPAFLPQQKVMQPGAGAEPYGQRVVYAVNPSAPPNSPPRMMPDPQRQLWREGYTQ